MPQYLSTDPNAGTPIEAPLQPSHGPADVDTSWSGSQALAARGRAAEASPEHIQALRNGMPMGGALIGSLVGGPLGAGAGGALGKGLQQATGGEMPSPVSMGVEGVTQSAMDLGGGLAAKGLTMLGRGVYGAGAAMIPKTLKQDFPNIASAGFREGIPLTARGADKAGARVGEVATQVKDKLRLMDRAGSPPVAMAEGTQAMSRTGDKVAKQGLRSEDQAVLADLEAQYLKENPLPMKLVRAHEMKQAEQRLGAEGYKKIDRGADINSVPLDARMDVARGLREAIEQRVPSTGPQNARIQDLMGLERAGEHASSQSHILSRLLAAGGMGGLGLSAGVVPAIGAAGAGAMLTTPQGLTTAGLGLKSMAPVASHSPQAARLLALLAALSGDQ